MKTGYPPTVRKYGDYIIANGTDGVLSTLFANGNGTVSTIVAKGSERVNVRITLQFYYTIILYLTYLFFSTCLPYDTTLHLSHLSS